MSKEEIAGIPVEMPGEFTFHGTRMLTEMKAS